MISDQNVEEFFSRNIKIYNYTITSQIE